MRGEVLDLPEEDGADTPLRPSRRGILGRLRSWVGGVLGLRRAGGSASGEPGMPPSGAAGTWQRDKADRRPIEARSSAEVSEEWSQGKVGARRPRKARRWRHRRGRLSEPSEADGRQPRDADSRQDPGRPGRGTDARGAAEARAPAEDR